jgi:hypothetical protein
MTPPPGASHAENVPITPQLLYDVIPELAELPCQAKSPKSPLSRTPVAR